MTGNSSQRNSPGWTGLRVVHLETTGSRELLGDLAPAGNAPSRALTGRENPHEWVKGGDGFEEFVALIRAGDVRRYRGRPHRTVTIDGWTYWLTWGGGPIVNRKPSAEAGWDEDRG